MSVASPMRRGWCPGALTPMQTGDGWLVRVRPRGGCYSLPQLTAIVEAAHRWGNGEIDVTNRANLQIRGLTQGSVSEVQQRLSAAGLLDDDAATEAIRNVIVSPTAGIEPDSYDARRLALNLEIGLQADHRLRALPGKFGFAVDGGGRFAFQPGLADIILRVSCKGVAVELAGAGGVTAHIVESKSVSAALALANAFVSSARANPSMRRMRDLVNAVGGAAIFEMAGLIPQPLPQTPSTHDHPPIGILGEAISPWAVGIGLPYGRISAAALETLVAAAFDCGVEEIRPSPKRALVVPLGQSRPEPILAAAHALGLIVEAGDPRLVMNVCPGAPACERGTTRTRDDADRLAAAMKDCRSRVRSVHVSGCAKGCAHQGSAEVTVVARDGHYDIIRNGSVSDRPCLTGLPAEHLATVFTADAGDTHAA